MTEPTSALNAIIRDSLALPALPANRSSQLSQYLHVAAQWISFAESHLPLLTVLACQVYDNAQPTKHRWARHISIYLLLGLRNRVNHHTLQHGIAGLLSFYQLQVHSADKKQYSKLIRQLQQQGQAYWSNCIIPKHAKLCRFEDCFEIAWQWQRWVEHAPEMPLSLVLHKLALTLPNAGLQQLTPLLTYPGLTPEGSQVKYQSQTAVVIHQLADTTTVYFSHDEQLEQVARNKVIPARSQTGSVTKWLALIGQLGAQPNQEISLAVNAQQWAIPVSFPVSTPPASLRRLLHALNDPDVAIQKVVDLVSAEPMFGHFLTDAASKDNRMQLPVNDLKQSILTYGLERVGNMLVQYALYQRLTQHRFPLSVWFGRLTQIATVLSSELAATTQAITPQSAGLITTVALSPLFTVNELKSALHMAENSTRLFDISTLTNALDTQNTTTRQRLLALANAWQQDKAQSQLIACCGKLPDDVPARLRLTHCITGLSIIWARQWLLGQQPCPQTELFISQTGKAYPALLSTKDSLYQQVAHLLICPLI
ncbi:MAG: HDOD domain-containing protein [Alteromonadaceae bacterium]|nr:HDOD domain-containing protein [Alteromonadaceae bacterium]